MYDYLLGGKDNYAVDRETAKKVLKKRPEVAVVARENRRFLGRAVRYLAAECGVRQFIDIGTGIPARGNTHEVARSVAPDIRVAYVDNDPIVLVHDRALLSREEGVVTFLGDLLEPASVLDQADVRELIDFRKPVAVLFAAVFHFITDDHDPQGIVESYRDRMAPGSAVVVSHLSTSHRPRAEVEEFVRNYQTSAPLVFRPDSEIIDLFDGFTLAEPGLVTLHEWRPDSDDPPEDGGSWASAAVGLRDPLG